MSDIRDLVGDGLEPDELERLARVHALLEQAGPPPPLPAALSRPPAPDGRVIRFPRRRRRVLATAAVAAAVLVFAGGYVVGGREPAPVQTVAMSGPGGATATIEVFAGDNAGNWPMRLHVAGLRPGSYALWLTRDGALVEPCGTFAVASAETTVPLNAPYPLRDFDGWVVVPAGRERPVVLTTT